MKPEIACKLSLKLLANLRQPKIGLKSGLKSGLKLKRLSLALNLNKMGFPEPDLNPI